MTDAASSRPDLGVGSGDEPIEDLASDQLGRDRFARALADEVLSAPATGGYVIGLTGPWGSGKTSLLNMAVDAIGDRALVVQFNPWMFSGTEGLVTTYFAEVGKQLGKKTGVLKDIGSKLADYGRVLSPIAGLAGAGGLVDTAVKGLDLLTAGPSVGERRQELRDELEKLDKRLVVIIDDVDRLRPDEVRDIVRLVRLVGDFPNTVYLLAFDRGRVEECLGEGDLERGRAYLEKIIQVAYDVPAAREPDITTMVIEGLGRLLEDVETGPFDGNVWTNVFTLLIRPLLSTPRQARRYLQSLSMMLRLVGTEVALADVLALQAIRVTKPEMFDAIVACADALGATETRGGGYLHNQDPGAGPLAAMVGVDRALADAVCRWLFPAARRYFANDHYGPDWLARWRQQRRVAHPAVLRYYLELRLPDGVVPADCVDAILAQLGDRENLTNLLGMLSGSEIMDATKRVICAVELDVLPSDSDFSQLGKTALPVFLNAFPRFPRGQPGILEDPPLVVLGRLVVRFVQRVEGVDESARAISSVLQETDVLGACVLLVTAVGHREDAGTELVDEETARQLEHVLRERLVSAAPQVLAEDVLPLYVAEFMAETEAGKDALRSAAHEDVLFLSLLRDARTVIQSFNLGEVAVERRASFAWNRLVGVLGEPLLRERIADLQRRRDEGSLVLAEEDAAVLDLSALYAAGWRPDDPFQRLVAARQTPIDSAPASTEERPPEASEAG